MQQLYQHNFTKPSQAKPSQAKLSNFPIAASSVPAAFPIHFKTHLNPMIAVAVIGFFMRAIQGIAILKNINAPWSIALNLQTPAGYYAAPLFFNTQLYTFCVILKKEIL